MNICRVLCRSKAVWGVSVRALCSAFNVLTAVHGFQFNEEARGRVKMCVGVCGQAHVRGEKGPSLMRLQSLFIMWERK